MREPYASGESWTRSGQLVRFTCQPRDVEAAKEFLGSIIQDIDTSSAGRIKLSCGISLDLPLILASLDMLALAVFIVLDVNVIRIVRIVIDMFNRF